MAPNVLLAKVPALTEVEKSRERSEKLNTFWNTPIRIPFAKKNVVLSDIEAADKSKVTTHVTDTWTAIRNHVLSDDFDVVSEAVSAKAEDMIRVVTISDTHEKEIALKPEDVPEGDVLVHSGDVTLKGKPNAFAQFREWMGQLPHKHKLVIAGNHDLRLDDTYRKNKKKPKEVEQAKKEIIDVPEFKYLQEDTIEVEGYKFYGSPMQPCISLPFVPVMAFQKPRGAQLREHWSRIPEDTDVLITHGPPTGFGDLTKLGIRAGCFDLLREVQTRVKPLVHVFGHIHENNGATTDGQTLFVNASTCNFYYKPKNPIVVFDLPRKS